LSSLMRKVFTSLEVSVSITVPIVVVSFRGNILNINGIVLNRNVWCAVTHKRVIGPFFFNENIVTSTSFLDKLENYALLQVNNNNLTFQMDGAPVQFANISP
jgi:hypothetical protein